MMTGKGKVYWPVLAVCLWISLIGLLSNQTDTQQSIQPLLRSHFNEAKLAAVLPDVTIKYVGRTISAKKRPYIFLEFSFRKAAHVFVYSILAILAYSTAAIWLQHFLSRAAVAFSLVLTVAGMDEWNQSFSPDRTGIFNDVILDLSGAIVVLLFIAFFQRRRK